MLTRLTVRGFKSLRDVSLEFPRLAVLFGPNSAGKSNLLEAIHVLSRIGTQRTLADAMAGPLRGHAIEAFLFPPGGLAKLILERTARFSLEADLTRGREAYRYRAAVEMNPGSGSLSVADEYLTLLDKDGAPKGAAAIELVEGKLRVRRKAKAARPQYEELGQNYAILSDVRRGAPLYPDVEKARAELSGWRTYYLEPRVEMRVARPPSDVRDIGALGEEIAPFLFRLRAERPREFAAVERTLRSIVPSVEGLTVDLDQQRGTLDVLIRQGGVEYPSRVASEGTLRVLALCSIAVNPWGGSLVAFEEPENGVHPRRLELIAQLLLSLALERERQVVVTTHSPLFCDAILKALPKGRSADVGLFHVTRERWETKVKPFDVLGPLFTNPGIRSALSAATEDGLFESLLLRGLLDE